MVIAPALLEDMLQAARAAAPEECCGLLVGTRDPDPRVTRLVPAKNIHGDPQHFFTLDPVRQFALLRELRNQTREILLGHYHSHPDGPAEPSPRDLAEADDPDMIWLVIDPAAGRIGAFRPRDGVGFDRLTIESP